YRTSNHHCVEVVQHTIGVAFILSDQVRHVGSCTVGLFQSSLERLLHLRRHRLASLIAYIQGASQSCQNLRLGEVNRILRRRQGKPCLGNVRQQTAKPYGHQQQRLEAFANSKEQKNQTYGDHYHLSGLDVKQATACPE